MAEICVHLSDSGGFKGGDILAAPNNRAIRFRHASVICNHRTATRNGDGLIPVGDVCQDFYEATHQTKRQRIATGVYEETDRATRQTTQVADPRIDDLIRHWKKRSNNFLFGTDGREVWYCGRKDFSNAAMAAVWSAIEAKTTHRESSFVRWPATREELKRQLWLQVDDFDEAIADDLVSPVVVFNGGTDYTFRARRKNTCDWDTVLGLTAGQIATVNDPSVEIDLRGVQFLRSTVVREKTAGEIV